MGDVDSGQAEKGRERMGRVGKPYRGVMRRPKRGGYICNYFSIFQNVPLIDMPQYKKFLKIPLSFISVERKLFD